MATGNDTKGQKEVGGGHPSTWLTDQVLGKPGQETTDSRRRTETKSNMFKKTWKTAAVRLCGRLLSGPMQTYNVPNTQIALY